MGFSKIAYAYWTLSKKLISSKRAFEKIRKGISRKYNSGLLEFSIFIGPEKEGRTICALIEGRLFNQNSSLTYFQLGKQIYG